ncbi:hypothetical protein BO85DRAFT_452276 [Aspergillus piperis CBS 112811]|uniref:Uncharacterized protein n=1 Tax=Aspergillus piperis CBS 112811 TaxID=1448313 RepID=A0A8G1QXS4_9EURO|nr:hypothetical protein BO85DRAFT_452276 [Aspergillus piperis CBS 112811]RAH54837.1 hypothetical protein BO85DRAFT_452276 [Aspergillus piperis CBS 112811]
MNYHQPFCFMHSLHTTLRNSCRTDRTDSAKHPLQARIPMVTILHVYGNIRTIFATFTVGV